MGITLLVIIVLIFFALIYQPLSILRDLLKYFLKDTINRHLFYYKLKDKYKSILKDYNIYYNRLDPKNQKVFERRLAKFLAMKLFIPRAGLAKVTDEMKVLISAKAIQITFGHPSIYFEHFWRILVYPDAYYSEINRQYHKGEVNTKGYIILSWRNFIEGISNREDGINLGLHEMAHALHLENAIMNNEYNFLDEKLLSKFNQLALEEMEKIREGKSTFFRVYAGSNYQEFFAVMIENFFERSEAFRSYHPELYEISTHLMQQDPLLPNPVEHYFS